MDSKQEILILAILSETERYGYEINAMVNRRFFRMGRKIALSSIYAVLTKLYQGGLVSMREVSQSGRPPRKLYGITFSGRERLEKGLFDIASAGYEGMGRFELILISWPMLTSEQRRKLLSVYYKGLEEIRTVFQENAASQINPVSAAHFERYLRRVAAELTWLREFSQKNDVAIFQSE